MIKKVFAILFFYCIMSSALPAQNQIIETSGDIIQLTLPTLAGVKLLKDKDYKGIREFAISFSITVVCTQILKRSINKRRPNGEQHGFPSGHTSSSFQASTFILKKFGYKFGIPAMIAAGYVGFTRTHGDLPRHDWEDVFAGAAIGILGTWFTTSRQLGKDKKLEYGLSSNQDRATLFATYSF